MLRTIARAAVLAIAALAALTAPAVAQNVIGGYRAEIGAADLVNSRGAALSHPWQVIRQDRANVHRFGLRQPGDELDPWFGSAEMRAALEGWVRYGGLSPALGAQIMAGGVMLHVEVLGYGNSATGVRVTLAGAGGGAPGGDDLVIAPE